MTLILVIVGLSGALLAFFNELDEWVNPAIHRNFAGDRLDVDALIQKAQSLAPEAQVESIWFGLPTDALAIGVSSRPGADGKPGRELGYDQLLLNPVTGEELARREWGAISQGWQNLMPFIYKLHYSLALKEVGVWILGIAALVWTFDCFIGFYLTLPICCRKPHKPEYSQKRRGWLQRWKPSWLIKWNGHPQRINFDIHRACGLWTWLMLFVFAWSSVAFNLNQVYRPVMDTLFGMNGLPADSNGIRNETMMDWPEAYAVGLRLMREQANEHGFSIMHDQIFYLDREHGRYFYTVRSSADIGKYGSTEVSFDAVNGQLLSTNIPGSEQLGETLTHWLIWLHTAAVFGTFMQVFVCLMGLLIVALSITGVFIWLRKRKSSHLAHSRQARLSASHE